MVRRGDRENPRLGVGWGKMNIVVEYESIR